MNYDINPEHNVFFASDAHFWHKNVIRFDGRPFETVEEMNETIISNWNAKVRPSDTVFYLGDFCFAGITKAEAIAKRLNGTIHFIEGNHDYYKDLEKLNRFASIQKVLTIDVTEDGIKQRFFLSHYPHLVWDKDFRGVIHLFGHCHQSVNHTEPVRTYKMLDVGVNGHGYAPLSAKEIIDMMATRQLRAHSDPSVCIPL